MPVVLEQVLILFKAKLCFCHREKMTTKPYMEGCSIPVTTRWRLLTVKTSWWRKTSTSARTRAGSSVSLDFTLLSSHTFRHVKVQKYLKSKCSVNYSRSDYSFVLFFIVSADVLGRNMYLKDVLLVAYCGWFGVIKCQINTDLKCLHWLLRKYI